MHRNVGLGFRATNCCTINNGGGVHGHELVHKEGHLAMAIDGGFKLCIRGSDDHDVPTKVIWY